MNISITGNLGAGKSSICRRLEQAGYSIISAGSIFRQIAEERGISVADLNEQVKQDMAQTGASPIDALLDERTARINEEQDGIAFDARLAWAFAEGSYKVFVCVDIDEAARRIYSDASRAQSESYESVAACREKLLLRQHLESERFLTLYHLDYYDLNNYDLVIDSTHVDPGTVAERILKSSTAARGAHHVLLNPETLRPAPGRFEESSGSRQDSLPVKGSGADPGDASGTEVLVYIQDDEWLAAGGWDRVLAAKESRNPFIEVRILPSSDPEDGSLLHVSGSR